MTVQAEERIQVLKMIDAGKISVDEGFQLLTALEIANGPHDVARNRLKSPALDGKRVRLRVSHLQSGQTKAQASLPLRLLEVGLMIGSHYSPELKGMRANNLLESLSDGLNGEIVNVVDEEKRVKVEVYIE